MFWKKFYELCENENSKPNPIGKKIGISSATITQWKQGTLPDREALVKIADYFDCSVDYLLGRTNNPQAHKSVSSVSVGDVSGNSGAIGVGNTVTNAAAPQNKQGTVLIDIFNGLDPVKQAKLLVYADSLLGE